MSYRLIMLNLTFVAIHLSLAAMAAPHLDSPAKPQHVDHDMPSVDPERVENIAISPVRSVQNPAEVLVAKFNKENYFYPYRQDLDIHAGIVFGIRDSSDDSELMNLLVGFDYTLPKAESPKWNLGADLSMVGHGHFFAQRRFVHNQKGSFRPFYQLGLMHKLVPEERFASFSNWDNYLARAGIGLSDIIRPPRSVQIELNIAAGLKDILVMFTYGYAWGF